jgi:hypothetical protein
MPWSGEERERRASRVGSREIPGFERRDETSFYFFVVT